MKSFKYIARDSSGGRREGLKESNSANEAVSWLREQGFTPVSVNVVSGGKVSADKASVDVKRGQGQARQASSQKHVSSRKRVKSAELSSLCWQLNTLVHGGIPITSALDSISEDIENPRLRQIMQHVLEEVQRGETFSESIGKFPKVFNRLSCAMILAGETGGNLPAALRRLAEYFDNRDKLAKKVKGAMAYPAFIFGFIVLIVIFIMAFIIPRFRAIFDQIGGELPAFTQLFMGFYDLLKDNLLIIIGALLFTTISAVFICSKTRKGHFLFSKFVLAVPLFGKVLAQAFLATFCRTMATLLDSGVSVLEVFDILSAMSSNDIITGAITRTRKQIVEGSNISASLAESGFFPRLVAKMVEVGEESGSLSRVLDRTAEYYERRVDATVTTLLSLLEPIMIVSVGGIVSVVVIALYLPIFSMSDI